MTRQDIEIRVREVLHQALGTEAAAASLEATMDDLGADSLDRLEISLELEIAFDIALSDEEGENVRTVGDMVTLVAGKLSVPA